MNKIERIAKILELADIPFTWLKFDDDGNGINLILDDNSSTISFAPPDESLPVMESTEGSRIYIPSFYPAYFFTIPYSFPRENTFAQKNADFRFWLVVK